MPKQRTIPSETRNLRLLVSSTVYGFEDLLDQVYAVLHGFGYEVWMSHKGTVPVDPGKTAFENCLEAVDRCDLFLSIITPFYGSGKVDGELSITHQELLRAIEKNKPRWIVAHDHIPFAGPASQSWAWDCKRSKKVDVKEEFRHGRPARHRHVRGGDPA